MLTWLRTSSGPKVLTGLVSRDTEITHASLDALSQDYNSTHHFRKLLVATGVLPERNANLARLELWSADVLARLPQPQMKIIRPFAEWHIIRDARRRSSRGRYTTNAATSDRRDIRAAIDFLNWLDEKQLDLAASRPGGPGRLAHHSCHTPKVDRSLHPMGQGPTTQQHDDLTAERTSLPTQFITETALNEQLKRCLDDDQLPLALRHRGRFDRALRPARRPPGSN
ncbi:hypothetical protein ACIQJT_41120 [Streptomyces sp. NPDC091972]|uniref:hypothetical protein n=1 Tax=Streptomyces sp. NPDC091972 TaxID=3366007 RepID=UPI00381EFD43